MLTLYKEDLPLMIRVSLGSALTLGLTHGVQQTETTTIYLMTYHSGKCSANCVFCSQARSSTSRADMLSRVIWPLFPVENVINRIKKVENGNLVKRVCIQTMNYPGVFKEMLALIKKINSVSSLPISLSCQPMSKKQIQELINAGVDRIGISLDAATEELFKKTKGSSGGGPYLWEKHMECLKNAIQILGKGKVTTHFIVGLGENDRELIEIIQRMVNIGVHPSLFAFTPIPGTSEEKRPRPSIHRYRKIQLAQYLITNGKAKCEDIVFDVDNNIVDFKFKENLLREIVKTGLPFMTSGCSGCNRPYYNERPSGPLYNYPFNPVLNHKEK